MGDTEIGGLVDDCGRGDAPCFRTGPTGHQEIDLPEVRHRPGRGLDAHKGGESGRSPPGQVEARRSPTSAPAPAPFEDGDGEAATLDIFWHRAGWLVMLLMFQSTSSLILEHFEALIRTHPVVIYFLTMLVGAGGNAGGQSTVLVVRKLALRAIRGGRADKSGEGEFSLRGVVGKEVSVGGRLALILFVACFLRCMVFKVRGYECLAICLSMLCIVFTSTLIGSALPLLLSRLHVDPAHAGAAIQVIMDISGVTLTCVVSCLVLGIPLGGIEVTEHAASDQSGIQREGTLHALTALGSHLNSTLSHGVTHPQR